VTINQYWVAATAPVFVLSVYLLARTIGSLTRTVRGSVVLSVPVREEQSVQFDAANSYLLNVEGKRFTTDFAGYRFSMTDPAGRELRLDPVLMRTAVTSFSRVRLEINQFTIPAPGAYTLRVHGIRPAQDPENRIVFTRPIGGAIVGYVLALVLLGALTIGSLVGSILIIVLPRMHR
jgi:hypothetical protein